MALPMAITVSQLHVYPVKGLAGISLARSVCTDRGLAHDRRWMVVDPEGRFLSQRELPRMATVWTELDDGQLSLAAPDVGEVRVPIEPPAAAPVRVQVWKSTCSALPVSREADGWLSDYLGLACRLVYMPDSTERTSNPQYAGNGKRVGFADGYAYLVVGGAARGAPQSRLAQKGRAALPMNRFRPNIVVSGARPFDEDRWRDLAMGQAVLRAAKPCGRCEVTTTDQSTGERRGPEPLETLASFRESREFGLMFGMNYVTGREGAIAVGDTVHTA
jgi:uncharacterized protein YcbX